MSFTPPHAILFAPLLVVLAACGASACRVGGPFVLTLTDARDAPDDGDETRALLHYTARDGDASIDVELRPATGSTPPRASAGADDRHASSGAAYPIRFDVPAETSGTSPCLGPDAVIAIVRVPAPWYAPGALIRRRMRSAVPEYASVPGLAYKLFAVDERRRIGGVYLWRDRAFADAFYDERWRSRIRRTYGEPPELWYLDDVIARPSRRGRTETGRASPPAPCGSTRGRRPRCARPRRRRRR